MRVQGLVEAKVVMTVTLERVAGEAECSALTNDYLAKKFKKESKRSMKHHL